MNKNYAFSTAPILLIISSLCVLIMAVAAIVNSYNKKLISYKRMDKNKDEAEQILEKIIEEFQIVKDEKCDNERNQVLKEIIEKYKENSLSVKDVSTGINQRFWDEKILESKEVKKIVDLYQEELITEFGWCNKNICSKKTLENLKKEFNEDDITKLFPLINVFPILNLYNMNQDFIFVILKLCSIKNTEEKANELYTKCGYEDFDKKEIAKILDVNESHNILNYLGCKTVFWEISFETDFYFIKAIIAAIPYTKDKIEKIEKIEKYILIEKNTVRKYAKS